MFFVRSAVENVYHFDISKGGGAFSLEVLVHANTTTVQLLSSNRLRPGIYNEVSVVERVCGDRIYLAGVFPRCIPEVYPATIR